MLYFNGVDSVSISKRLGHAQVSTTANIYAHAVEAADQRNADILADVFLKKLEFQSRVKLKLNYSIRCRTEFAQKVIKTAVFLSKTAVFLPCVTNLDACRK